MKKKMNLQKGRTIDPLINALATPNDELVGCMVEYKDSEKPKRGESGSWQFIIIGCQKVWGYDENGVYGFPRPGYRIQTLDGKHDKPAAANELKLITFPS